MNRLRVVRIAKKMSVHDVAAKMEVSAATISRIERGLQDPSLQLARKLYEYFKDDGLVAHDFIQPPERRPDPASGEAVNAA